MTFPIYLNLERLDRRLIEASYDLGARELTTFRMVIFPLSLPGVLVGILLVFIPSMGAYVEPTLLGGANGALISSAITLQFKGTGLFPFGSAMASVVIIIVLVLTVFIVRSINIKKIYPEL
jgi:spermidine/putrescine transport system permease protein